jgi:hypothetical protein
MKVQCPACKEIVSMTEFITSETGLTFQCSNCNKSNFLANPQAGNKDKQPGQSLAEPIEPTELVTCPKCGNGQKNPIACDRCGLVFSKFDESELPPDPPEGVNLWLRLQDNMQDQELHETFIATCVAIDRQDYAARQYRILSQKPALHELANNKINRILTLSQAKVAPGALSSSTRADPKNRAKIIWWIGFIILAAVFAYLYFSGVSNIDNLL